MKTRSLVALVLACAVGSCATTNSSVETLARGSVTSDFATYPLRRVGVLPFRGAAIDRDHGRGLQATLAATLGETATFEVVALEGVDLEEVPRNETYRRGVTNPNTILTLAKRYQLDAILVGTVTEMATYAPQRVCMSVDLVAAETGLAIWTASAQLDASNERVRRALETWFTTERSTEGSGETWDLYLLSPRRFSEFAVDQLARCAPWAPVY